MTDVFYFECSEGTRADVVHAVKRAKFGDGYSQIAKNGINSRQDTWSVVLNNLPEDDCALVMDFLDRNVGRPFQWTPPRSTRTGLYTCSAYSPTPVLFGLQSITATFEFFAAP